MEIKGERVMLRPISMEDLPHCTRWAGDPEVMHHVIQRTFTPEEEREWLEGILRSDQEKAYVIWMKITNPSERVAFTFPPRIQNYEVRRVSVWAS